MSTQPARVLLAEDNSVNQLVALRLLKKMGYQAEAVVDGLEVLRALEENTGEREFQVLLMDCQMPNQDGYETSRLIRARGDRPYHRIPIIAMTANTIKGDREKCLEAGMDDYISKPIDARELEKILAKWLSPEGKTAGEPALIARVKELRDEIGEEGASELVQLYLETTRPMLEKVREALSVPDFQAAALEAHTLKSSSANLGAVRLVEACRKLEALKNEPPTEDNRAKASHFLQGMEAELAGVHVFLRHELTQKLERAA